MYENSYVYNPLFSFIYERCISLLYVIKIPNDFLSLLYMNTTGIIIHVSSSRSFFIFVMKSLRLKLAIFGRLLIMKRRSLPRLTFVWL
jgi:hypothetical protein